MALCLNYFYCYGLYIAILLPGIVSGDIDTVFKVFSWRLDDVLTETKVLKLKVDNIDNRVKNIEEKLQGLHVHATTPNPIDLRIEDERMEPETKLNENLQIQALVIKKMLSKEKVLLRTSMENFTASFAELKSEIQTQMSVFNASVKEELKRIGTDFNYLKSEIRFEMMEYNKTLLKDISDINAILAINLQDMYEISNNNSMVLNNGIAKLTSDWNSTTHNISQIIQTVEGKMVSNIEEIEKRLIADVKQEQNESLQSISTLQEDVQSFSRNISTVTSDLSSRISSESSSLSSQISSHSNRIYRLEERIDECLSSPCMYNATCVDGYNSYSCICLTGYSGTNCEIDINECSSEPCRNGGLCADNVNGYNCTCQQGYEGINCETGTCSKPADVANANLRSKYRNTEEFTEGSEVEYDCNIGYSITGRSRNRKCLNRNWSPVEFECELIRCTYLPHPDNGRRTDANNGAGETTRFSCNPGYTLKGPSQLICRTDGEWSPRYTPKCEPILCPELLAPRNGDIFQDTSDGVRNNYESIVQYTCNYGYTINGTKSRTINRRCEADGTWDGYNYFCDTLKCEHIEFYGGTLNYFGSTHRAEGTYVYYSCHEGYTMFPSGVDYSECMRTSLRWKPDPPKCHGNCRLQDYQPIDKSLVRRQKDGERKNVELADSVDIIHGEKIIFSCKNPSSYELCVRPNDQVLCTDDTLSDNFDITCTNGTFDKVNKDTRISCQERRCDVTSHMATQTHACYWKDDDQDGQCRRYGFKVDSQSSINIKCLEGFELQETLSSSYQNVVSSKMKCIKGTFSTEYSCSPKRCDVSNLPYNENTIRKNKNTILRQHRPLSPITPIDHDTEITYNCKDGGYELYVNSSDTFLSEFTSKCSYGQLNVSKERFPICIERRCDVTSHMARQTNSCYWKDDDQYGQCRRNSFKVDSRSSINIECNKSYELYETKRRSYQTLVQKMECIKGHFSTEYSCLPKRCVLKDLPTNKFTVRTPGGTHLEHGKSISYTCKNPDEYELYVQQSDLDLYPSSFSSICSFGEISPSPLEFPLCLEKHCEFQPWKGVCYHRGQGCHSKNVTLKSQESVTFKCTEGYKLVKVSDYKDFGTELATLKCMKGKPDEDIKCVPENIWTSITDYFAKMHEKLDEASNNIIEAALKFTCRFSLGPKNKCKDFCIVDRIENGVVTSKVDMGKVLQEVEHGLQVYTQCNEGYDREGSFINTCENGEWKKSFPQCNPKPCDDGEIVLSGFTVISHRTGSSKTYTHGTKLNIECASGYTMEISSHDSEVMTTECVLGVWKPLPTCIPKQCLKTFQEGEHVSHDNVPIKRPTGSIKMYDHGTKLSITCASGYTMEAKSHVSESMTTDCVLGVWKPLLTCIPKSCRLLIQPGSRYFIIENNTNNEILESDFFPHGTNVSTECITGYDMVKLNDSSADDTSPEVMCGLGSWKNVHLCKKRCSAINSSTVTNSSDDNVTLDFRHGEKVKIKCITGDIEATCDNGTLNGYDKMKCQNNEDNYLDSSTDSKHDPANTDSCRLLLMTGTRYYSNEYNTNNEITESGLIPHGTNVSIECITGYDMVKLNGSSADNSNPQVTCSHGSWKNIHLCKKRCEIPMDSIYEYRTENNTDIEQGYVVKHGTVLNVKCRSEDIYYNYPDYFDDGDHQTVQCINGQLGTANISCPNETTGEEKTFSCDTKLKNGRLQRPSNRQFDEYYLEVSCNEGYKLNLLYPDKPYCKCNKTEIVCTYGGQTPKCLPENCKIPEKYDPRLTIYERSNGSSVGLLSGITVKHGNTVYFKCINSATERFEPYDTPFECMKGKWLEDAKHEEWLKTNSSYFPQCIKVNCEIPKNYDSRLNIHVHRQGSTTSLSGGMSVNHAESVLFSCTNSAMDYFELEDIRLECMKGKWLRVATHEQWLKFNSSNFPQCRKAICIPLCQNGGKCIRDDTCACQPQSTGSRCETVECDLECQKNGGMCIAPGKCGQCPVGQSGKNCQDQGCPRPVNVPRIKQPKDIYKLGETIDAADFACPQYHDLMPRSGMLCSTRGWTETVECKPRIKYVIQIKTGKHSDAGTYAQVYLYLHGEKYSSEKFNMGWYFYRDRLYEVTMWATDITPIRYITLEKDSIPDDLQVDFVSVFVDFDDGRTTADDQFYNFDAVPDMWIDASVDQRITISGWPENCVHKFQLERLYPLDTKLSDNQFLLGQGYNVSERTCKQRCVMHAMCNGVYYWNTDKYCMGFQETSSMFLKNVPYGNFLRRSCLK